MENGKIARQIIRLPGVQPLDRDINPGVEAGRLRPCPRRPRDAREAVVALVDVARCYRGRTFSQIVQAASRPRTSAPRITPALETAVTRFHGWAPYAPVSGKCLLRSFMLLRTLRRQGLDALWVFGVRTWPFHAHCWLQCEDTVLDDPAERIWAYTPIMVV